MKRQQERDGGASVPLLPEVVQSDGVGISQGASISSAIFNVSTSMVGAGIMSIPATFKVLGIIPSFIAILIIAFFVEVTVEFLLKYTRHTGDLDSYGALMAESFGKPGAVALRVCVWVTNLGAMTIYLIIIGMLLIVCKYCTTYLGLTNVAWFTICSSLGSCVIFLFLKKEDMIVSVQLRKVLLSW